MIDEYNEARDLKDVLIVDSAGAAIQHFDAHDFRVYSEEYVKRPSVVRALCLEVQVDIVTPEGTMRGNVGDYLVQGIKGEFYPCKAHIFEELHDKKK